MLHSSYVDVNINFLIWRDMELIGTHAATLLLERLSNPAPNRGADDHRELRGNSEAILCAAKESSS
jgi:hypothetical protein